MTIEQQLFEGTDIRLGPIDFEKDPEVESRWTHDLSYLRMLGRELARPLSPAQLKKKYEGIEKGMEERNLIYYTIRRKEDELLLGFMRLFWLEWSHGTAHLQMGIGDPAERGKGYGSQALSLILRFAFDELNLYRLSATVGEDNPGAHRILPEVRFRGRGAPAQGAAARRADLRPAHARAAQRRVEARMSAQLFRGALVRLAAVDPDEMSKAMPRWNLDSEFYRMLDSGPQAMFSAKKVKEWIEKDLEKDPAQDMFFSIRALADDRLIGFMSLFDNTGHTGDALVGIGIGEREYWGKGYGTDAMRVMLDYVFNELNYRRLSLIVFEHNPRGIRSYEKAGFVREGRLARHDGARWAALGLVLDGHFAPGMGSAQRRRRRRRRLKSPCTCEAHLRGLWRKV